MEKIGEIEIKVIGKSGNQDLKPNNYDIKDGSVKHIFKTTIQTVIGFSAILSQIETNKSIDFLELKTARAIENIQNLSVQKDYEFAKILFRENRISEESLYPRAIITNDSKLFAQADFDKTTTHFVTSDVRSKKTLALLKKEKK